MLPPKSPPRVAVENVWPRVDDGEFPIRRVAGAAIEVLADVFVEGAFALRAMLAWRMAGRTAWTRVPMTPLGNDRWHGRFPVDSPGTYEYLVEGWVDTFLTWRTLLERRIEAGTVSIGDLTEGIALLERIAAQRSGREARTLREDARRLREALAVSREEAERVARDPMIAEHAAGRPAQGEVGRSSIRYRAVVDPPHAGHSAWYELFPRSTSPVRGRAGTFRDLRARLPYIADLGFDVVYLPPIHPIGESHRRGPNNRPNPPPDAPGSPWAIGGRAGGHTAIHPDLGTIEEFRETLAAARRLGLDLALDLAFQCSPDHPWVREHPEWFQRLPDGSFRTAENPPKRYDDIYPLDFETTDWRGLWTALKEVVEFWADQGIRWFRVDNPHTKPFEFWRWLIGEVRRERPDVLFLAEAFTRPKVMYRLAKIGFTHSYTYFAWRTTRGDLTAYFEELTRSPVAEYFRPHLWPNTPDILTEQFHRGQRSVFVHRLVLAATLSPHYGIYGPVYELGEHTPTGPGKEEYLDSEKYEVRHWNLDAPHSLAPELRRVNRLRRENPALRQGGPVHFHRTDNDRLLAYSRRTDDGSNVIVIVVSLDPDAVQSGWTDLDLAELGVDPGAPFDEEDVWANDMYQFHGSRNLVRLDPAASTFHVLRVRPPSDRPPAARRSA